MSDSKEPEVFVPEPGTVTHASEEDVEQFEIPVAPGLQEIGQCMVDILDIGPQVLDRDNAPDMIIKYGTDVFVSAIMLVGVQVDDHRKRVYPDLPVNPNNSVAKLVNLGLRIREKSEEVLKRAEEGSFCGNFMIEVYHYVIEELGLPLLYALMPPSKGFDEDESPITDLSDVMACLELTEAKEREEKGDEEPA